MPNTVHDVGVALFLQSTGRVSPLSSAHVTPVVSAYAQVLRKKREFPCFRHVRRGLAFSSPSGCDCCCEHVLVDTAEGWIDGVAGVPIIRPDRVNRVRAGSDLDVVSYEGLKEER